MPSLRLALLTVSLGMSVTVIRPSHAQSSRPLIPPADFSITQWTSSEGLPQNSANAVVQGPDGYLWIGTFGGLVRFDGSTFRLEPRIDSTGSHIDRILALAIGSDSAMWIGTEDGLLRYRSGTYERFSTVSGLPDNVIRILYVDQGGAVWVGTPHGIARYAAGRVESLQEVSGERVRDVSAVVEDAEGTLWVSASSRFLTIAGRRLASARWRGSPVVGGKDVLLRDHHGALWFAVAGGVAQVLGTQVHIYRRIAGASTPLSMTEDPDGGYWIGTIDDGLFYFQPDSTPKAVRRYALPDGRKSYRVRAAYVDAEGDRWFGTNASGLVRIKRNVFATYSTANGLSDDVATAVIEDSSGVLWAGTNCGGLNALDWSRQTVTVFKPRKPGDPAGDPCIFALTGAAGGTVWVGTWGGGLSNITGGRVRWLRYASGLRDSVVLSLFTDRSGAVWVGTNTGGLASLRDGRVSASYTTRDGLADNSVHTIAQTRDGALWIGTLRGLSRLSGGRFTTYRAADGLSAEYVRAVYEDSDGDLWIGTYGGGLDRWHNGKITAVRRGDGLSDDVVSSILADGRGYLWMSGNQGIFRVARSELLAFTDGRIPRIHSVLYGRNDGLREAETNGGFQPSAWKDARGRLWFPTLGGIAVVDPARVPVVRRPPPVRIEEIVVNGVSHPPAEALIVGPGRTNLELRYTGISLSDPQDVTFRYRLEGFDETWVEAGRRRVAFYPGLPPGAYRFDVTAANRDGIWAEPGSGLSFGVRGPIWSTWWFRLTAGACLLAVLLTTGLWRHAATLRHRRAQEEFARQLIESQEHERKRIAGELHDGLGQDLLVVKNRALVALQDPAVPGGARDQLRAIAEVVTQSLEAVRGLAHNLTPYQLDHLGLSQALQTMVEEVEGTAGLHLTAHIENIDDLFPVEAQINLFRIVQEGLSNVLAHAGAATATVTVRRGPGEVTIAIVDDGRGFRVPSVAGGRLTGGFGLSGMSERAHILGGQVHVVSGPGQGTRLELSVPMRAMGPPAGAETTATQGER